MEKNDNDPSLVPEWYRTGGLGVSKKSKHHRSSSSISDDLGILCSPRNRSLVSTSDHGVLQSSFSTDMHSNSSYHRRWVNGSITYNKDNSTHSTPYSSFNNRSYQDKGREKHLVYHDKRSSTGLSNGYSDYSDITHKDTGLRSQTKVHGGLSMSESKWLSNDLNNGVLPGKLSNGMRKSSFENDFPSLLEEEKFGRSGTGRMAVALSLDTTSVTITRKECTSALAKVPSVIGGIQPITSSAEQSTHAPTTSTGLSMAEALAKGPSHTQAIPQLSLETQRLKELAIKQSRQLRPVTPTTPKTSVVSSLERSKAKATKTVLPKGIPQLSSQPVNNLKCGFPKSDSPKIHQGGNFHVLNRDRNGLNPTANKTKVPLNASNFINSDIASPKIGVPPDNPKLKTDKIQNSVMEKRHLTQDRIRFFNNIRNGSSVPNSSPSNKSEGQTVMTNVSVCPTKEPKICNGMDENCSALIEPKNIDEDEESSSCLNYPTEEERKFLISLGWKEEDAQEEEALTAKEIGDFFKTYHLACRHRNINISAAVRRFENLPS